MNKIVFNFLYTCFLIFSGLLSAEYDSSIEIRTSAFFPLSQHFMDVFGDVGPTYGIEASKRFCCCFEGWVDIDQFYRGSHQGKCCKTSINILNASFGIKYIYPLCETLEVYMGIGPTFGRTHLKNKTCCEKETFTKVATGVVVKGGIYYPFCDRFFADFFVDYLYLPINLRHEVDIGGIKTGVGLGINF
jgi:hypothetical protein